MVQPKSSTASNLPDLAQLSHRRKTKSLHTHARRHTRCLSSEAGHTLSECILTHALTQNMTFNPANAPEAGSTTDLQMLWTLG